MSAHRKIRDLSRDLADRAESFCAHFFPKGRKQGNYWQIGDTSGVAGQSLAVRLQSHGGRKAGQWTDYVAALVMLRICDWALFPRQLTASRQHNVSTLRGLRDAP